MSSTCIQSLDLCAIRVSLLTAAGAPSPGATNGYVSDAAQQLTIGVELSTGAEFEQKNGCGDIKAAFKEPDKIKRATLGLDLTDLDAYLLRLLTGVSVFSAAGNAIGWQFPAVGSTPDSVCVEAWCKAWQGDEQYVAPFTTPDAAYIHWVFPRTTWTHGSMTQNHGINIVPVTATGAENSQITANGPFNDWPVEVAAAGGVTRIGGWFYDTALPANVDACDYIDVPSGS